MSHKQYLTGYEDGMADTEKFLVSGPTDTELFLSDYAGWYCGEHTPQTEYEEGYQDGVKKVLRDN